MAGMIPPNSKSSTEPERIPLSKQRPRPFVSTPHHLPPTRGDAKESHPTSAGQRLLQQRARAFDDSTGSTKALSNTFPYCCKQVGILFCSKQYLAGRIGEFDVISGVERGTVSKNGHGARCRIDPRPRVRAEERRLGGEIERVRNRDAGTALIGRAALSAVLVVATLGSSRSRVATAPLPIRRPGLSVDGSRIKTASIL